MTTIEVLEERVGNLSERVDSHDTRHSLSIGELRMKIHDLELFKERVETRVLIYSGFGSIIGSLLVAIIVKVVFKS